jgi:hypothetical protein
VQKKEKCRMEINLDRERELTEGRIKELEKQVVPIERELAQLRERLIHVKALMPEGIAIHPDLPPISDHLPKGFWANLAKEHGQKTGGDSAHRVIRRNAPDTHRSIPHLCEYDGRRYP